MNSIAPSQIHPKQFGFQTKNSLLQLADYIENAHKKKASVTYSLYLDYEKAFDIVLQRVV